MICDKITLEIADGQGVHIESLKNSYRYARRGEYPFIFPGSITKPETLLDVVATGVICSNKERLPSHNLLKINEKSYVANYHYWLQTFYYPLKETEGDHSMVAHSESQSDYAGSELSYKPSLSSSLIFQAEVRSLLSGKEVQFEATFK